METINSLALKLITTRNRVMPNDFIQCQKICNSYTQNQSKLSAEMKLKGITDVLVQYNGYLHRISFMVKKGSKFQMSLLSEEIKEKYTRNCDTWYINFDKPMPYTIE